MRVVELVEALRLRLEDPRRRTDFDIRPVPLLPVADREELDAAEASIGHSLHPALRLALTQVANGGFGPGAGLLGVGPTGHRIDIAEFSLNLPDFYRLQIEQDPEWNMDQLVIADHGCAIWETVSLSTGEVSTFRGDTDTFEAQHFEPTGLDLEARLLSWARALPAG